MRPLTPNDFRRAPQCSSGQVPRFFLTSAGAGYSRMEKTLRVHNFLVKCRRISDFQIFDAGSYSGASFAFGWEHPGNEKRSQGRLSASTRCKDSAFWSAMLCLWLCRWFFASQIFLACRQYSSLGSLMVAQVYVHCSQNQHLIYWEVYPPVLLTISWRKWTWTIQRFHDLDQKLRRLTSIESGYIMFRSHVESRLKKQQNPCMPSNYFTFFGKWSQWRIWWIHVI